MAYRLNLPSKARIHPIFHVSQLKKAVGPTITQQPLPTRLTEEIELAVTPKEVKEICYLLDGMMEVLVKWEELPDF